MAFYRPLSTKEQVEQAVQSCKNAFLDWSNRTVKDRCQILIRYHQLVIKNKERLADLIVLEHGKTKEEALAEIAKGNETVEYAISLPQVIIGNYLEVSRGVACHDIKKPLGVVCSIVPFNFPFMVLFFCDRHFIDLSGSSLDSSNRHRRRKYTDCKAFRKSTFNNDFCDGIIERSWIA
jgi:acyl-CoA reductase-like NAD-dependent aldehyde dehydrogenase